MLYNWLSLYTYSVPSSCYPSLLVEMSLETIPRELRQEILRLALPDDAKSVENAMALTTKLALISKNFHLEMPYVRQKWLYQLKLATEARILDLLQREEVVKEQIYILHPPTRTNEFQFGCFLGGGTRWFRNTFRNATHSEYQQILLLADELTAKWERLDEEIRHVRGQLKRIRRLIDEYGRQSACKNVSALV